MECLGMFEADSVAEGLVEGRGNGLCGEATGGRFDRKLTG